MDVVGGQGEVGAQEVGGHAVAHCAEAGEEEGRGGGGHVWEGGLRGSRGK